MFRKSCSGQKPKNNEGDKLMEFLQIFSENVMCLLTLWNLAGEKWLKIYQKEVYHQNKTKHTPQLKSVGYNQ